MTYRWRPETGDFDGRLLLDLGLLPSFADQASAEQWLTVHYEDLSEQGVTGVSLLDGDRLVYGPMSLEA